MRIAIDLDGPIFSIYWDNYKQYEPLKFGGLVRGAREAITRLHEAGHYIIIHTSRIDSDNYNDIEIQCNLSAVMTVLDRHFIPYDEVWVGTGKPRADVYIDDRAIRFERWGLIKIEGGIE